MGNKSLAAGASLLIGASYVAIGIVGFFIMPVVVPPKMRSRSREWP